MLADEAPSEQHGGWYAAKRPSIKSKMLVHGDVRYYTPDEPPIIDWVLPEKIAMSKLSAYTPQQEYRVAFAVNRGFGVENTRLRLVSPGERRPPRTTSHPERLLKLGSLANHAKFIASDERA
ncbi:MAG: hypothetical protein ACREXR_07325 [Gammaproteobacteria bacterium]